MTSGEAASILSAVLAMVCFVVSGIVIHAFAGLRIQRLSIGGLFWYFYGLMVVLPSIWVFYEREGDPVRYLFLFAAVVALPSVAAGILVASAALGFDAGHIRAFYDRPLVTPSPSFGTATTISLGLCVAVTLMYFIESPSIPLLYAIQHPGEAAAFTVMRQESFRLLDSPFLYLYFIVRQTGWPFVVSLLFTEHLRRRSSRTLVVFLAALALALFYAAATLIRGPAAVVFIVLTLTWLVRRSRRIKPIFGVVAGALILGVPIGILALFSPARSLLSILEGIGRRLYYVPADNGFYFVDAFTRAHPLLYGRSIEKIALFVRTLLPNFATFDSSNYIFRYAFPDSPITTGSAAAPFFGDAFANFGIVGVVLFGFLAGLLMQLIQAWLCQRPKDSLTIVCYATLLYSFWELNRTALTSVLISYGALTVIVAYYAFRMLEQALFAAAGARRAASMSPE